MTVIPLPPVPFRGLPAYEAREPVIDHLWVVVPFSKAEMSDNIRANLARQRFQNFSVLVVRNGAALDQVVEADIDLRLEGVLRVGKVRNLALDTLAARHPNAYWVGMDDDDWYGPEYLVEHAALAKHGRMVGKSTHWVHMRRELLLFNERKYANERGTYLNGATLGGFVSEMPRFSEHDVFGEDSRFSLDFARRGGEVWLSSIYHTVYCRRDRGHTYNGDFFSVMGNAWAFPEALLESLPAALPVEYPEPDRRTA